MARPRHRSKNSTAKRRDNQREKRPSYLDKIRWLTRSGKRPDPTNRRAINRAYREAKARDNLERFYSRPVTGSQRAILKKRGFYLSKRGVAVDGPRDGKRQKIPGAKFEVLKDGVIKWTKDERRDFVYGFTAKEKKEFAKDPELFTQKILKRLRETNPTLKKIRPDRIQKRIQFGAFQAQTDFTPSFFTRTSSGQAFMQNKPHPTTGKNPRDYLTGLHFTVHIPKPRKRKTKRVKGRKRK